MATVRKTIAEWEQEYGIYIIDMDGFDTNDSELYLRLFTQAEFETAIASCTIVRRHQRETRRTEEDSPAHPDDRSQGAPPLGSRGIFQRRKDRTAGAADEAQTQQTNLESAPVLEREGEDLDEDVDGDVDADSTAAKRSRRALATRWRMRRLRLFLILFTLPTLATIGIDLLYGILSKFVPIRWYWPALLIAADFGILFITPIAPVFSGPLYLWYLVAGALFHGVTLLLHAVLHLFVHSTPTSPASGAAAPFLENVQVAGNPLPLYFHFGTALTSGLVWGIAIASFQHLRLSRRAAK